MAHVIMRFGYNKYVLPTEVAFTVAQAITDAERYEAVYVPPEQRVGDTAQLHYIWTDSSNTSDNITLEIINDDFYRLAKLAGKPESKR